MTLQYIGRLVSLSGLALALVAVLLDRRWFTWIAIAVLVVAFAIRLVVRRQAREEASPT